MCTFVQSFFCKIERTGKFCASPTGLSFVWHSEMKSVKIIYQIIHIQTKTNKDATLPDFAVVSKNF